jgi:hypothetical protein
MLEDQVKILRLIYNEKHGLMLLFMTLLRINLFFITNVFKMVAEILVPISHWYKNPLFKHCSYELEESNLNHKLILDIKSNFIIIMNRRRILYSTCLLFSRSKVA